MPIKAPVTIDWINQLDETTRKRLVDRIHEVQSWVKEFCGALGKKSFAQVRMTLGEIYYGPWANRIGVPVRMLLEVDDKTLRIAVAHECAHCSRRWRLLLARSDWARLREEVYADKVAMQLTATTPDDLQASLRVILDYEPVPGDDVDSYIETRLKLLATAYGI